MSTTLHMRISCCMGLGPEQQHNKCLTASTATTYSSALLEKVFLQLHMRILYMHMLTVNTLAVAQWCLAF